MSRRSGLGRGLAALIPPSAPDEPDEPGEAATSSETSDDASSTSDPPGSDRTVDEPSSAVTGTPEDELGGVLDPSPTSSARAEMTSSAIHAPMADDAVDDPARPTPVDVVADHFIPDDSPDEMHQKTSRRHEDSAGPGSDGVQAPIAADPIADPGAPMPAAPTPPEAIEVGSPMAVAGVPASAATLAEVALGSIVPNPRQPREVFDPEELAHLAVSLADIGVLQPLVVRPLDDGGYELVAGERRLRAAALAGLETVPVVVRHTEDADLLKEALVENIHRVQLNPLEEGAAYQQLLEEFGVTQEELAARLGRSRPAISNAIRLLQLPSGVQRRVASGVLSAGHAKVLLAVDHPEQQVRLADRIVAEGLSVRATEELVRLRLLDEPSRASASRRRPTMAPGLVELQDDLSDALEARVKISMGAKRGRLAIEFASVDDLERIVSVIANGLEGGRDIAAGPLPTDDGSAPDHR